MKRHHFLAYSALQLMVAQLIANKLPLSDARFLWLSTPHPGSALRTTMEAILRRGIWSDIRWVDFNHRLAAPRPNSMFNRPLHTLRQLKSAKMDLVENAEIVDADVTYLPHPRDWTSRALAQFAKQRGRSTALFEEGLGLYHLDFRRPDALSWLRRSSGSAATLLRDAALRMSGFGSMLKSISRNIDDLYCFFPSAQPSVTPRRETICLSAYCDRDLLAAMGDNPIFSPTRDYFQTVRKPGRAILFVSSVDVEDLLIERNVYILGIRRFLRALLDSADQVLFKSHPRNDMALLDEVLAPFGSTITRLVEPVSVPLELCWKDLSADLIAGTHTSPLAYIPMLYGARAVSAVPLLLETGRSESYRMQKYAAIAERFCRAFGGIIEMMDSTRLRALSSSNTLLQGSRPEVSS